MFTRLAACLVLTLAVAGPAQAQPFTAKDMATLDRMSDPHISADGRFVAYNVRSTDRAANHGTNALWVLERGAAGSPPRLIRDQEKTPTQPRWSADGNWLYFLSSRSGSVQVWRVPAGGAVAKQVTDLPLDVAFYRIAPDGRTLVLAINVHPDCDTLACSKAKDDAKAKIKATGTVYDTATPRFWDTYLDGRYINLFAGAAERPGACDRCEAPDAELSDRHRCQARWRRFGVHRHARRRGRHLLRPALRLAAGPRRSEQPLQRPAGRERGPAPPRSQGGHFGRQPRYFARWD